MVGVTRHSRFVLPNRDSPVSDREIERDIDAIDRLRETMRRAGLLECADALDHAFVKCLKDYMARKGLGEPPVSSPKEDLN